jgi:hypothetical protein
MRDQGLKSCVKYMGHAEGRSGRRFILGLFFKGHLLRDLLNRLRRHFADHYQLVAI